MTGIIPLPADLESPSSGSVTNPSSGSVGSGAIPLPPDLSSSMDTTAKPDVSATVAPPSQTGIIPLPSDISPAERTIGPQTYSPFQEFKSTLGAIGDIGNMMNGTPAEGTQFGKALMDHGFSSPLDAIGVEGEKILKLMKTIPQEVSNITSDPLNALKILGGGVAGSVTHPLDTAFNIFNKTVGSTLEAITGVKMSPSYEAMTPEDRAAAIQDVGAAILSYGAAAGVSGAMKVAPEAMSLGAASKLPEEALGPIANQALPSTGRAIAAPAARGFASGLVAGLGYGVGQSPGQDRPLENIAATAFSFGTLGAGLGMAFPGASPFEIAASDKASASFVLAQRALHFANDKSFGQTVLDLQTLQNSHTAAEAVLRGSLPLEANQAVRISGVSPSTLGSLTDLNRSMVADGSAPTEYQIYHRNGDEALLLHPDLNVSQDDIKTWTRSGFLPNETVDYQGVPHVVTDGDQLSVQIRNPVTDEELIVPHSDVQQQTRLQMWDVEGQGVATNWSESSLMNSLYDTFKENVKNNPDISYLDNIKQWASIRGIPENQIEPLTHAFANFLQRDAGLDTDPDLMRIKSEQDTYMSNLARSSTDYLVRQASAGGFYIDSRNGGGITLRDGITGDVSGRFQFREDAIKFIKQSGRVPLATDLTDGIGNVPAGLQGSLNTSGAATGINARTPFKPTGKNFYQRALDGINRGINLAIPWFTMKGDYFTAFDEQHGTDLYNQVYDKTQKSRADRNAFEKQIGDQHENYIEMSKGLSEDEMNQVGHYLETASPEDIMSNMLNRPMSQLEINMAHDFTRRGIDGQKILDLIKAGKDISDPDVVMKMFGLNDKTDPKVKDFTDAVSHVQQGMQLPPDQFRHEAVLSLSEALQHGSLSREDYAIKNNMSGTQLAVAHGLDNLYEQMEPGSRSRYWINHYRNFRQATEFNLDPDENLHVPSGDDNDPSESLARNMARTGELDNYLDNPHEGLQAWTRAYSTARYMNGPLQDAIRYQGKTLNDLRQKGLVGPADMLQRVSGEYLRDIRGFPDTYDDVVERAVKGIWNGFGLNKFHELEPGFLKRVANGILSWTAAGSLGFKPELGLRDWATTMKLYAARFGVQEAATFGKNIFSPDHLKIVDSGLPGAQGLSPVGVESPGELTESNLGSTARELAQKVGDIGLATTGQRLLYPHMSTSVYLTRLKAVGDALESLRTDRIDKGEFASQIHLQTFSTPVQAKFDDLVTNGRLEEANQYLARVASAETVLVHGLANHPLGWGSAVGRVAFQFGQWAVWDRNFVANLLARGSTKQSLSAAARLAVSEGATYLAGKGLGLNLSSWSSLPTSIGRLGPIGQFVQSQSSAFQGKNGTRQQQGAFSHLGNLLFGTGAQQDKSEDYLSKKASGLRSFVPGGGAAYNWYDALENRDYNPLQSFGRGLGFRVSDEGSFADYLKGGS